MKRSSWFVGAVVVAAALFCSRAEAAPIMFYSGDGALNADGTPNELVNGHAAVTIRPHPAWGDVSAPASLANGTAKWISYANTGYGAQIAPNVIGREIGQQTALFSRTFELFDISNFSLWTLADDTAAVTLLGPGGLSTLFTAFAGQLDPCAPGGKGGGVGCMQADMGLSTLSNLAAGVYTLQIYAFQTNKDVFGAQYAGNIESVPVPEPGTLILMGTAAVGFFANRRRRRASSVI